MKMVVFVTDVLSAPLLLLNKKAHKCAVSLRNRLDDFMHLVEDEQGEEEINNATFECILQIVSAHFQISEHDLLSRKRVANIVCARQVAMFLTKNLLDISIPEIGMRFGGRDHTTVIHSINRIQDEMNNDPEFKDSVYLVRDKITTNGAKHSLEN
jgi:chromosomal replication initiation ATPase DnaA